MSRADRRKVHGATGTRWTWCGLQLEQVGSEFYDWNRPNGNALLVVFNSGPGVTCRNCLTVLR